MEDDLLDSVLSLEEEAYQAGFEEGKRDGSEVGFAEGVTFGIEQGFQKTLQMARLHGQALALRACMSKSSKLSIDEKKQPVHELSVEQKFLQQQDEKPVFTAALSKPPTLLANDRLRKHIDTLIKLTDTRTLTLQNSDDAVEIFDQRMKKAIAKAKVIDKLVDERFQLNPSHSSKDHVQPAPGSGNIEELNSLSARR